MTLSDVIDRALMNYRAMVIVGDERARDGQGPYIAAAVAAHLTSEAVIARAHRAALTAPDGTSGVDRTRAALAAIGGGDA